MNLRELLSIPDGRKRQATRGLQLILAGLVVYGLVTVDVGLLVNATVGLAVTFVPALLRRDFSVPMDPGLTLWITFAVLLHAIGTLGPYRQIGWYDQVAHLVSAGVVAAVGYAAVRAVDIHDDRVEIPPRFMFVFILVFVMAFGVFWEILEFAIERTAELLGVGAPLTQFGVDDVVLDLLADAVGGLVIALWGTAYLSDFSRALARWLPS